MWKVVHIAQKHEHAKRLKELLQAESFLVDIKEGSSSCFEIRVPESEVEEANEILYKHRCFSKSCG